MKPLFDDTDPRIEEILLSRIRAMTPQERFARIRDLNRTLDRFITAEVRRRHPDATAYEVRMRVVSRRIPADLMKRVYGWSVEENGY